MVSTRAEVITRRTYNRPLEDGSFETWEQTINRVISHQEWLWERAKGKALDTNELEELDKLRTLLLERKVSVAGRTLWLGGTDVAKRKEISQFNCTAINVRSVYDIVDVFWCLLNGAGVGFRAVMGSLTGFKAPITDIEVIYDKDREEKGNPNNVETFEKGVWTIIIGDSAESWSKAIGKLMAHKYRANKLVLDFSEVRREGYRLKNYGWISNGSKGIANAFLKICDILNRQADSLLTCLDIQDVVNLLGTVLSSRRSAQLCLMEADNPELEGFIKFKNNMFDTGKEHRTQSNNSIFFRRKPTYEELSRLLHIMRDNGNGEPGIINGQTMKRRAPWADLVNP